MDGTRKIIAEFVGAFTLIFAGVSAIEMGDGGGGLVGVALAHGLAIGLMVCALAHISGAHFNPAITLAMLVTGRVDMPEAVRYWASQLAGAAAAAICVLLTFGTDARDAAHGYLGTPDVGPTFNAGNALVAEIIATFFLVFVVFGVAVDKRGTFKAVAGLPIGLMITVDILAVGGVSGAAMNPARWFGPAIVSGHFDNFWIYLVGPAVGALLAAFVYDSLLLRGTPGE